MTQLLAASVVLVLAAAVIVAVMHRQEIRDHFSGLGYEPTPRVEQLREDLSLTDAGDRIFLATRPTVDAGTEFNDRCAGVDHAEQGHVLGCYKEDRIHLFEVRDERIDGIVEVTAAHELLHAAYGRLGEGDRTALAERLRREYERLAEDDPELRERMSVYEHLSDGAFANELHSVLGTEVRELPPWLEEHFGRWLSDRDALVDRFVEYHSVFVALQDRADELQEEMSALREEVERRKADYDVAVDEFNAEANDFAARNGRAEFADDPEEFERIRSELDARRGELEEVLEGLQADIDRYNALREQLAALSEVSSELEQQLNSELAPVTTRPDE
ncbi:hypothetical protein [Leucobacter massiliensis]|uniref:hypothetical protein n=1 Tax=Leucobacter massiliensis TaxID=1686285 RepID=UPI001FE36BE9|nr:hypothetical protein [Leucobacter massiliensis]